MHELDVDKYKEAIKNLKLDVLKPGFLSAERFDP